MADSDWELVEDSNPSMKSNQPSTDWELTSSDPNSMQTHPNETLGQSAIRAVPRIGEDIYRGIYKTIAGLPEDWQSVKRDVPQIYGAIKTHPLNALGQGAAGFAELGHNIFNSPHDIANYAANRLNLLPQDINQKIQMARMPDFTQEINATFGTPQNPGEEALRWEGKNVLNQLGGFGVAKTLNPMNLTAKSIAKDVINTAEGNKKLYSKLYDNLWKDSSNKGFDNAMYNVNIDIPTLQKFSPTKSIKGVLDFDKNPSLQTAHAAKSDLLRIQRDLNKMPTLRSAERQQLNAANNAIDSINSNMFIDKAGNINKNMLNRYNLIQKGYADEVIPYKNKMINKFKRNEISAKELVNSLSSGEFAAKRGNFHPEIGYRNIFKNHPYMTGAGIGGLGKILYDNMLGNGSPPPE